MLRWALLAGCVRPVGDPIAGDVALLGAEGWVVRRVEMPLECPDGAPAELVFAFADEEQPVAVIYHSGAFDWAVDGVSVQDPPRLGVEWPLRAIFATLGMADDGVAAEADDGALAAAFVDAGVAMALPTNCWGDLWRGVDGATAVDVDGFPREGATAARMAFEVLDRPDLAVQIGVDVPVRATALHAIGLGVGGHAVGALAHAGLLPDAAAVDSVAADLSAWREPGLHDGVIEGLARIFPDGDLDAGSLVTAPLPDRLRYVYSSLDPLLPAGTHERLLARLPEGAAVDVAEPVHVPTRGDPALAAEVVAFLLDARR